jgi:hypothetical protein
VRWSVAAALALSASFAGCMEEYGRDPSAASWPAFGSGRGLVFGTVLVALLVAGVVVLITNLSGHGATPPPPAAPPVQAVVEPTETKSAKPKRRTP